MSKVRTIISFSVGGAIWGCLLGIVSGAVCGSCYGLLRNNVSLGLDGALLGGAFVALLGGGYGACLALQEVFAATGTAGPASRKEEAASIR